MTRARALVTPRGKQPGGLFGIWPAIVVTNDDSGLSVQVPQLAGQGVFYDCESFVFDTPLAAGDRVYVGPVRGNRDHLVVMGRRA